MPDGEARPCRSGGIVVSGAVPMTMDSEYRDQVPLHRGRNTTVVRAIRARDGAAVILKMPVKENPGPDELARLHHEYEIARRFDDSGVVAIQDMVRIDGRLCLVMADDGSVALREVLEGAAFPVADAVAMALALVQLLATVHKAGIVHKDICPDNIVWNRSTGALRLIDFGISVESGLDVQAQPSSQGAGLEGTLAYIAPEQTGRMKLAVDYRADFYALGATLYHVLTGMPPFSFADASEAVHAHLARVPVPPCQRLPTIPQALSDIVMTLLAKAPEDRYQRHDGLIEHLTRVQDALDRDGNRAVLVFRPGGRAGASRFRSSGRLHGRLAELAMLGQALDRAAAGRPHLALVAGAPGVGKTALVRELIRRKAGSFGLLVTGKCDAAHRHQPYAVFVTAIRQWLDEILAGPPTVQGHWRDRLLDHLGVGARLLTDLIPEMTRLLGERPVPPEVPAREAEIRLLGTLQRLVRALAGADRPLLLFLDDLQWIDMASIHALQQIVLDTESVPVLVVGACRDTEVDRSHPLEGVAAAAAAGQRLTRIALGPLPMAAVVRLVGDLMGLAPDQDQTQASALADLCLDKTGGNPFFLVQFLERLRGDRLIAIDEATGTWRWDARRIRSAGIADNVLGLMLHRIGRLEPAARDVLRCAACFGGTFDLETVAQAAGLSSDAATRALAEPIRAGLVVGGGGARHAFAHDRIHEAAYSLTPPGERPVLHLVIGRHLAKAADAGERLFEAVDHLNQASGLIVDSHELDGLIALNRSAAERARSGAAFEIAAQYAMKAIQLLPGDAWRRDFALTMNLHLFAARMAALGGGGQDCWRVIEAALPYARHARERAALLEVRIEALLAENRLAEAIALGLDTLRLLGFEIVILSDEEEIRRQLLDLRDELAGYTPSALVQAPEMGPGRLKQAVRIAAMISGPAGVVRPDLVPHLVLPMVSAMLRMGQVADGLLAYPLLGALVADILDACLSG